MIYSSVFKTGTDKLKMVGSQTDQKKGLQCWTWEIVWCIAGEASVLHYRVTPTWRVPLSTHYLKPKHPRNNSAASQGQSPLPAFYWAAVRGQSHHRTKYFNIDIEACGECTRCWREQITQQVCSPEASIFLEKILLSTGILGQLPESGRIPSSISHPGKPTSAF